MIQKGNFNGFDRMLAFSDWRFSAAAVGLIRYFNFHHLPYETNFEGKEDVLLYHYDSISPTENEDKYYAFAENYYAENMHHLKIKSILEMPAASKDDFSNADKALAANTVMKKIFGKIKASDETREEILTLIESNRIELIKETYRSGKSTYANFCNSNSLGTEEGEICRLLGYYADLGKKKKSLAFYRDYNTYVCADFPEFDFIPFAFSTGAYESFFINNNFSTEALIRSNDCFTGIQQEHQKMESELGQFRNYKLGLFFQTSTSVPYLNYQVEIICKSRSKEYFETMYLRDAAIEIFQAISNREERFKNRNKNIVHALNSPCRISRFIPSNFESTDYYPVLDEVVDSILNLRHLDYMIDPLLREDNKEFLIQQLIYINEYIYQGVKIMEKEQKKDLQKVYSSRWALLNDARNSAKAVIRSFQTGGKRVNTDQKVKAYRNKLIACLSFKDYDRFATVLLQLSEYSSVPFEFAYELFKNFEQNKNLAYTFVNALQSGFNKDADDKDNAAAQTETQEQ